MPCDSTKEVLFSQQGLGLMLPTKQGSEVVVHEDSEGAILLVNHPLGPAESKYLHVRGHFIPNEFRKGPTAIKHIRSENPCAIITEPVPQEDLVR